MEAALLSIANQPLENINDDLDDDNSSTDDNFEFSNSMQMPLKSLKQHKYENKDCDLASVRLACLEFAKALHTLALQYEENKKSQPGKSKVISSSPFKKETISISEEWLLSQTGTLPSVQSNEGMSALQLSLAILSACQSTNEEAMNAALFDVLGAGEKEMELMFELAPKANQIRLNITEKDLRVAAGETSNVTPTHQSLLELDVEEEFKQALLLEYEEAANIAAITKAQLENNTQRSGGVMASTHSINRGSDKQLAKAAKRAAKVAAEKLRLCKEAGIMVNELDAVQHHLLGGGVGGQLDTDALQNEMIFDQTGGKGMKFMSHVQIQRMQQELLPEGTKQYYDMKTGLPTGTEREMTGAYEKVTIPAAVQDPKKLHRRLGIDEVIPTKQMRRAFSGTTSLNPMQSSVFEMAFHSQENLLICAPTGAGKTNVAMLTIVAHFREKGIFKGVADDDPYAAYQHIGIDNQQNESQMNNFSQLGKKVIYIAPMKALAQEVVEKFSSKLKANGIIVRELTGDMQLTRAEADSADIIVTTPEKWDVVTRKGGDGSLSQACGLLIIDEVHLLADERGAVIESVVARLHRLVESSQRQVRLVGLSATLPNYEDVASFLRVDKQKGLFFFGPEHRPVPLQQTFIGVKEKSRFKKEKQMNEVCYETVVDSLRRGYQVMVFVHSRKGTGETCEALADIARERDELNSAFVTQGTDRWGDAHSKYADKATKSRNRELTNHFHNGMGIHHAGMLRNDRKLSEQMFADGAIKVLCCTATLAWGVSDVLH